MECIHGGMRVVTSLMLQNGRDPMKNVLPLAVEIERRISPDTTFVAPPPHAQPRA